MIGKSRSSFKGFVSLLIFKRLQSHFSCADSYTYECRAVKQEADFHSLIATEAKTNTVRPRCVCSVLRAHAVFAGLIRRTPPPTFSDTATLIPLFSSSELTVCGYPGLMDRKNRSDMCPRWDPKESFRQVLLHRMSVYCRF